MITSLLIGELEQGDFSIARFYERRARRILPALFFVMLCCLPFAWAWMLPNELTDFSQSLVAVTLSLSNILFWREEGYFAAAALLKPLLHTWSLAVEEQYYVFFPILLLSLWRFGRNRVFWVIVSLTILSFVASEWGWHNMRSASFYLAPTRGWELLAGSLCAFWLSGREQPSSNIVGAAGLGLILFAIFSFDETTPFPSVYALVPVLGTALIIIFGAAGTGVAKLLGARALVGIGLISYSAYLWHQPLFAFARIRSIIEPEQPVMMVLAIASLILAYFSWRFIEKPFRGRDSSWLRTRRSVFGASGVAATLFIGLGVAGHVNDGFIGRFDKAMLPIIQAQNHIEDSKCHFDESKNLPRHPELPCLKQFENSNTVMLLGDSHAMALSNVLRANLEKAKISYYYVSYAGCLPLTGFRRLDRKFDHQCVKFNDDMIRYAQSHHIKTVVLIARFPLYLLADGYDNGEGGVETVGCGGVDVITVIASDCKDPQRRQRVLMAYEARIRELASKFQIVLVHPIPEAGWNVPSQAFKNAYFNGVSSRLTTSYDRYKERTKDVINLFARLDTALPTVSVARVDEVLCGQYTQRCINADAHGVYYFDDDHLSDSGARLVAPLIVDAISLANE